MRAGTAQGAGEEHLPGRDRHPVVHVAYEDAEAYARVGRKKRCQPRPNGNSPLGGGLEGAAFVWGDEFAPGGRKYGWNTWQGEFPVQNLNTDGYEGTSPVESFPPNGYGLYDMAGNAWEWTIDFFTPHHTVNAKVRGGSSRRLLCACNLQGVVAEIAEVVKLSNVPAQPGQHIPSTRWSRAARTCAHPATAFVTDRRPGRVKL